jgi:hypothetical protein
MTLDNIFVIRRIRLGVAYSDHLDRNASIIFERLQPVLTEEPAGGKFRP